MFLERRHDGGPEPHKAGSPRSGLYCLTAAWKPINRIVCILVAVTSCIAAADLNRLLAQLRPQVDRMMLEGKIPSATIALVDGDRVAWSGGFGHSNLWARTPAVPSNVYLYGSIFKTMSTAALLQLMEQGKFELDEPVSKYLKGVAIRGENAGNPVTFRHLLTHTSGLPALGAGSSFHDVWGDAVPSALPTFLSKELAVTREPLQKVEYSNVAFTLVGYTIEQLSGMPFRTYIEQHIFAPLAMTSTAFIPTPDMQERMAVPYVIDEKTNRPVAARRIKAEVWPAGEVYGTVDDLSNWLIVMLNGGVFKGKRILSEKTVNDMLTLQYPNLRGPIAGIWGDETTGFGLSWWVAERNGTRYFAHSGSLGGYTAFVQEASVIEWGSLS